jgi:hypothetical protein
MTSPTMCSRWSCCAVVTARRLRGRLLSLLLLLLCLPFCRATCCSLTMTLLYLLHPLLRQGKVLLVLLLLGEQTHACCFLQLLTQHLQLHVLKLDSTQAQNENRLSAFV